MSWRKLVVFVHGFLENNESAAGHASAMFKRLFWSGSRAGFAMVRWPADLLPGGGSGGRRAALHFQADVQSALERADALAGILDDFRSEWNDISVIAHSLGNMLVSEAIAREGSGLVDAYVMLNAAVPEEAYAARPPVGSYGDIVSNMVHSEWTEFAPKLYMSEWWRLFNSSNARWDLSWRGRFADVPTSVGLFINAYSPSEDVLALRDGVGTMAGTAAERVKRLFLGDDIGTGSWQWQEVWKGRHIRLGWGANWVFTHDYGGWAFNRSWHRTILALFLETREPYDGLEDDNTYAEWLSFLYEYTSTQITDQELQENPFFRKSGRRSPPGIGVLYEGSAQQAANFIEANYPELLARMVPAITGPAGSRGISNIPEERNLDLAARFRTQPWPRGADGGWLHRDHRRPAYVYVHGLFKELVKELLELD